jgi:signal transduction histidine kinase
MVRARDEFLAVAAHELRTPVTTIWGYASLLRRQRSRLEEPLPAQVSRATEMIDKQSLRLKRLIDRLLDLTRIDTGTLVLDKEPTDICGLVRSVAEAAQDMTGHPVEVVAPKAIWAQVDPTRLEEVVANLIDNAINYSHAVTSKPVEVKVLRVSSGTVQVAVRDHGHGIPRALRNRIFERYYRTEAGARLGGLGIGLYVSQQIVELHCGRIDIRAAPGGGARFVVTLPTGQEARGRGRGKALHPAETPSSPVEVAS